MRGTSIEDVKKKNEGWLMALPGVVGVGIGARPGGRVIQVYVKEATRELKDKIPAQLEGFFTEIVKVGEIRRL